MWQTSFYLFGSIGILWSLIWISLYSESDYGRNDELPLISIPDVSSFNTISIQNYYKYSQLSVTQNSQYLKQIKFPVK